jgi:hypothetical protein
VVIPQGPYFNTNGEIEDFGVVGHLDSSAASILVETFSGSEPALFGTLTKQQ